MPNASRSEKNCLLSFGQNIPREEATCLVGIRILRHYNHRYMFDFPALPLKFAEFLHHKLVVAFEIFRPDQPRNLKKPLELYFLLPTVRMRDEHFRVGAIEQLRVLYHRHNHSLNLC